MNVTFLVELVMDDVSALSDVAIDIEEDLTQAGYDVKSVAPWARPTLTQQGAINVPNNTTQQPNITNEQL